MVLIRQPITEHMITGLETLLRKRHEPPVDAFLDGGSCREVEQSVSLRLQGVAPLAATTTTSSSSHPTAAHSMM